MRKGVIPYTIVFTVLLATLLVAPTAARADNITVTAGGTGATVKVSTRGGSGGTGPAASDRTCTWTVTQANTPEPFRSIWATVPPPPGEAHGSGQWARWDCSDGTAGISWLPNSRPAVAPEVLAQEAARHLPLPQPQIGVNPVAGRDQFVNLPTWLWTSRTTWGARSATASVPGLAATATAIPISVTWTMGDGGKIVCRGPGTPYSPRFPARSPSPDCGYTYRHGSARTLSGTYAVTATIIWQVTWTASSGATGTLPPITRSSQVTLRVAEAQALN